MTKFMFAFRRPPPPAFARSKSRSEAESPTWNPVLSEVGNLSRVDRWRFSADDDFVQDEIGHLCGSGCNSVGLELIVHAPALIIGSFDHESTEPKRRPSRAGGTRRLRRRVSN